jgi:anti-sigma B factor antagonist
MARFSIDVSEDGQRCDLSVAGEIDLDVANQLAAMGQLSLESTEANCLVVDLANVTFMDSTGLGALVTIRNAAHAAAKDLRLRAVPESVQRLLAVNGPEEVFSIEPADDGGPAGHIRRSA